MIISKFEDIISWQKSKELTLLVYELFKDNRDFSFVDQIRRASVSIMNNIAEGFERKSNKEFIYSIHRQRVLWRSKVNVLYCIRTKLYFKG